MLHTDVISSYSELFPERCKDIDTWLMNGYNSVRLKFKDGDERIFTFYNNKNWKIETVDSFIETLEGRLAMLKISESYLLSIDSGGMDMDDTVITIAKSNGTKVEVVNQIYGEEARELYNKLTNINFEGRL